MKRLHANGIPARLMDVLETDGGWLTIDGLELYLGADPGSISRALWRLRARGMIEHRTVELAMMFPPSGSNRGEPYHTTATDRRAEWRFVTWGEAE